MANTRREVDAIIPSGSDSVTVSLNLPSGRLAQAHAILPNMDGAETTTVQFQDSANVADDASFPIYIPTSVMGNMAEGTVTTKTFLRGTDDWPIVSGSEIVFTAQSAQDADRVIKLILIIEDQL